MTPHVRLRYNMREAAKSLDIQGEMHRDIVALLKWKGFRVGEIVVNDRLRTNGCSNMAQQRRFVARLIWYISGSFISIHSDHCIFSVTFLCVIRHWFYFNLL